MLDFAPHTIDNSQPLDGKYEQAGASEVAISIDTTRKKLYRQRSPKETYFNKIVTAGETNKNFGRVFQKQDLIKQLQDQLTGMKTRMGRGGQLNNEKNMSQIRCPENTYQQAYPQIVKARHMKLEALDGSENKAIDGNRNEARVTFQETGKDTELFKPRRAVVAKSYDFTTGAESGGSSMRTRNRFDNS